MLPRVALLTLAITLALCLLYQVFPLALLETLAITFGTFAYHLLLRVGTGVVIDACHKRPFSGTAFFWHVAPWEAKLHAVLRVRHWKRKLPTYHPEDFDRRKQAPCHILQAMYQAELVHSVIASLSWLPLLATYCFGSFWVFFLSSLCASVFDCLFVLIQRYNRPRLEKLMQKQASRKQRALGKKNF